MKTLLLFSLLANLVVGYSQSTSIPDPNFEQALIDLNIDTDGMNGSILNADAQQIFNNLNVSNKNINDLSGIEAFTNLTGLDCSFNNLTTLDLTANTLLYSINAPNNSLVDIDLTNLQALAAVNVQNNQIDSLNFSSNPNLYYLMCFTNNLNYLNISSNTELAYLSCGENQLTGNLDISNLMYLEFFSCRYNQLTYVNTGMHFYMTTFNCQNNKLWELDLSLCFPLENVWVDSNNLVSLNVKNYENTSTNNFNAQGNPNLFCIQVDDASYSTMNPNWLEDFQSIYSEDCDWLCNNEIETYSIEIWPNPATNEITIKKDDATKERIEILTLNGEIIQRRELNCEEVVLDISELSKGVYLIKIGESVKRFIKN